MACEIELVNGNGMNDSDSVDNESDMEISTLKNTLKQKLLNENLNGNLDEATSSMNTFNGNGTVENGHTEDKHISDVEFENDADTIKLTPKKSSKGKKGKRDKTTASPKYKRQTPTKKISVNTFEGSVTDDQSCDNIEMLNKDIEEDVYNIDVVGDNDDSLVVENDLLEQESEIVNVDSSEEKVSELESGSVFSRLRNSMRFSISPRKQEPTSSINPYAAEADESSVCSLRTVTGRQALHRSLRHDSNEAEASVAKKRKADSEYSDAPQCKYFATNVLSERSPGWKFFSSPFSRFWSPKKNSGDSSVSSSTPLRRLHEEIDDSLTVNVDDSINICLFDDQEIELNQENLDVDEKHAMKDLKTPDATPTSWKCIIM